jgi:hypothetical protein
VIRSRPLLLYLRSRRATATVTVGLATTAALWAMATRLDTRDTDRLLGLYAVVACVALAGRGLAGADLDLDRAGAIDWRPRRAAHVALVVGASFGIAAASVLTGRMLGPVGEIARNAVGLGGVLALAAATLGATRAWIPVVLWAGVAPRLIYDFWPAPDPPAFAQALTWPIQAAASAPAVITAVVLGLAGVAAYAIAGPRA